MSRDLRSALMTALERFLLASQPAIVSMLDGKRERDPVAIYIAKRLARTLRVAREMQRREIPATTLDEGGRECHMGNTRG